MLLNVGQKSNKEQRALSTTSTGAPSVWRDGVTMNVTAISGSQLAVACIVDQNDPTSSHPQIKLFYQSQNDAIHWIEYSKRRNKWSTPSTFHNIKVLNGTGLAVAISGQKIRLYCQDPGETLREIYGDNDSDGFSTKNIRHFKLLPQASISAVNWNAALDPSTNLQIRVFSIDPNNDVIVMTYDQKDGGWADSAVQIAMPSWTDATNGEPAVAAVQGLDHEGNLCIDVFYQPVTMIGQFTALKMLPVAWGGSMDSSETPRRSDIGIVAWNEANQPKALDGSKIASASDDGTVRIWDTRTGQNPRILQHPKFSRVLSVVFSPDGSKIASGSDDKIVRIWDLLKDEPLHTLQGHTQIVLSVAFSPDGTKVISGSLDYTVRIWDAVKGQPLQTLLGHTGGVSSVAFSPDGSKIASGSYDQTIRIWDATKGQPLQILQGDTDAIFSVAFSPYGSKIASGSGSMTVIWDLLQDKPIQTLEGHTWRVVSVAFSSDGSKVISGSLDNTYTLRMWDTLNAQPLQTLQGHTGAVFSVSFSPYSSKIASGSDDKTVQIWDAIKGQPLQTPRGHTEAVRSVAFSPDGKICI